MPLCARRENAPVARDPPISPRIAFLLRAAVTLGAIAFVVSKVPFDQVADAIEMASLALLFAGFATQIAIRVVNAARIRLIARAQNAPLSYRAILAALFTTTFYGMMLPGTIGAGAATLVKYVGHGATMAASVVSMVMNRALETGTTLALGLFFWGVDRHTSGEPASASLLTMLSLLAPLPLIGLYASLFGRGRLLHRIARGLQRPELARAGRVGRGLHGLFHQFEAAGTLPTRHASAVAALSVGKELLGTLSLWCFAAACEIELEFITIAWMQAAVALLMLLPITLLGLGVREGALVFMSARFGVAASLAVTWSVLIFGGILVIAAIGGMIEARGLWQRRASERAAT